MLHTVLAIDDDPIILKCIKMYFDDKPNYMLITATSGEEGWQILDEQHKDISVILLDRMMPGMDGMEFLDRLNESKKLKNIPVIMQTAASEQHQIREGIKAGVFYYLTKPYSEETLVCLTEAAINDTKQHQKLLGQIEHLESCCGLTTHSQWELSTIEESNMLISYIASFFPQPNKVVLGISELITNAIEHGNLGITFDEKRELLETHNWEKEIKKRLNIPANREKKVKITYNKTTGDIILTIEDEGNGFNWEEFIEYDPTHANLPNGRGILFAKNNCFDELVYKEDGHIVECVVHM